MITSDNYQREKKTLVALARKAGNALLFYL
jgi:hypothetical protein